MKIPLRFSAVFEVNLHGNCKGTKIIFANKQLMEANPKVFQNFQHEISVKPEGNKYTDFLISRGDVYPNRKVKLEDAMITAETRRQFEEMCDRHPEAFSKNNKDIGRTTLIEMEIDIGDSLPVAQNPYTLPLKHHKCVRKEIETLETAGVRECSLSFWASPVIVVPKKLAPDKPPRRHLCVDYRRVNSVQQEVKQTDKGTGCLSLYTLSKINEKFAKLKGAKLFSTIDLRSRYYHIGLTHESQAKSAFVVPSGNSNEPHSD